MTSIRRAKPPTRRITIVQFYLVFEKILGVSALKSDKQEDFFRELYNDPQHSVTDHVWRSYV